MKWEALVTLGICLLAVLFPDRCGRLVEGLAKATYLPLHIKLLKLQRIEPDKEKYERLYTVRKIYIQVFAVLIGIWMLYLLFSP